MYLTLSQLKSHLNVEHCMDDAYIMTLAEVAEEVVERDLDRPLATLLKGGQLPAAVRHAMLLLVGNYYSNRETIVIGASVGETKCYGHLIDKYRNYGNTGGVIE